MKPHHAPEFPFVSFSHPFYQSRLPTCIEFKFANPKREREKKINKKRKKKGKDGFPSKERPRTDKHDHRRLLQALAFLGSCGLRVHGVVDHGLGKHVPLRIFVGGCAGEDVGLPRVLVVFPFALVAVVPFREFFDVRLLVFSRRAQDPRSFGHEWRIRFKAVEVVGIETGLAR